MGSKRELGFLGTIRKRKQQYLLLQLVIFKAGDHRHLILLILVIVVIAEAEFVVAIELRSKTSFLLEGELCTHIEDMYSKEERRSKFSGGGGRDGYTMAFERQIQSCDMQSYFLFPYTHTHTHTQ